MGGTHILVVEDDQTIREMVDSYLRRHEFSVTAVEDLNAARRALSEGVPHLIISEWLMPAGSGLELADLARRLQRRWIPVLMVTVCSSEQDKVAALNAGVDDILGKPFSPRELLARVNALLRRCANGHRRLNGTQFGLVLDPTQKRVAAGSQSASLAPTDIRLLQFFLAHPERAHSRLELIANVWGGEEHASSRTVDVQIRRLRRALQQIDMDRYLQTVQGVGYRLSALEHERGKGVRDVVADRRDGNASE